MNRRGLGKALFHIWECGAPLAAWGLWIMGRRERAQRRAFAFARAVEAIAEIVLPRDNAGAVPVRAMIMNELLCNFRRFQPDMALDCKVRDWDILQRHLAAGRGALIATVHTRMALAAHGALRVGNQSPLFIGFGNGNVRWSWGSSDIFTAISPDDPALFRKVSAALGQGRIVVAFADYAGSLNRQTLISPNLFAWAEMTGHALLHMLATLDDDGAIRITLGAESGNERGAMARARDFAAFVEARWSRRFVICRPKHAMPGGKGIAPPSPGHAGDDGASRLT